MKKRTRELSHRRSGDVDTILLVSVILLVAIGIIMVFSASWPEAMNNIHKFKDEYYFVKKQIMAALIGLVIMWVVSMIDYRIFRKPSILFYLIGLGFSVMAALKGRQFKGASRWLKIGPISFMPGDFMKVASILFLSNFLSKITASEEKFKDKRNIFDTFLIIGLAAASVIIQNDFGTTIIVTGTLMSMFIVAGLNLALVLFFLVAGSGGLYAIYLKVKDNPKSKHYFRVKRITAFLDPFGNKRDFGWQAVQSIYAVGSGGLFGVGLGKSKQKFFYIPESYNDFIFAIIGEELGFIGSLFIIILYMIVIARGVKIALEARDRFGKFVATGITALIAVQTIVHIGVTLSLLPTTGVTLPFISYGGTSLLIFMGSVGILLSISRTGMKKVIKKDKDKKDDRS